MAIDLTEEGTGTVSREEITLLVRKITAPETFQTTLLSLIRELDVTVITPAGAKEEILHGSFFYFSHFQLLEDTKLNEALGKYLEYQPEQISRETFCNALVLASILTGTITLPHDLNQGDIEKITKHHCLQNLIYGNPLRDLSREGAPLLLYGCLKVITNKLTHSSENQQPRQI